VRSSDFGAAKSRSGSNALTRAGVVFRNPTLYMVPVFCVRARRAISRRQAGAEHLFVGVHHVRRVFCGTGPSNPRRTGAVLTQQPVRAAPCIRARSGRGGRPGGGWGSSEHHGCVLANTGPTSDSGVEWGTISSRTSNGSVGSREGGRAETWVPRSSRSRDLEAARSADCSSGAPPAADFAEDPSGHIRNGQEGCPGLGGGPARWLISSMPPWGRPCSLVSTRARYGVVSLS